MSAFLTLASPLPLCVAGNASARLPCIEVDAKGNGRIVDLSEAKAAEKKAEKKSPYKSEKEFQGKTELLPPHPPPPPEPTSENDRQHGYGTVSQKTWPRPQRRGRNERRNLPKQRKKCLRLI